MPINTITYTQSKIGRAVISSGSGCHGQIRPPPSHIVNSIGPQKQSEQNISIRPTDKTKFRPIKPSTRTAQALPHKLVRPQVNKGTRKADKIPGRAYRVHTEATYTPETYSRSAHISTNVIQVGTAYTYPLTRTSVAINAQPSAKRPIQTESSTETATEGEDVVPGGGKSFETRRESESAPSQSRTEPSGQTSDRKRRQRRVSKTEIKRLNKIVQSGELRAIGHWTRAIRTWSNEVESELHAIKEGTRIIESLVGRLSLQ